jgi:hypothetical protein
VTKREWLGVVTIACAAALAAPRSNGTADPPAAHDSPNAGEPSQPSRRTLRTPAPRARTLAVDCGDRESLATNSTDRSGSFAVGARASLHGDVVVCTVTMPDDGTRACAVEPTRLTAVARGGEVKIVGPHRGELVRYRCGPR